MKQERHGFILSTTRRQGLLLFVGGRAVVASRRLRLSFRLPAAACGRGLVIEQWPVPVYHAVDTTGSQPN